MDLDEIAPVVAAVAATEPSVVAAWIFGSRAHREERRGSDLDVAILTERGRPLGDRGSHGRRDRRPDGARYAGVPESSEKILDALAAERWLAAQPD